MYAEARIAAALQTMVRSIEAPPVPFDEIRKRIEGAKPRRRVGRYLPAAAAAVALLVLALPRIAPGVTQTIEQQVEAIMQWTPPPVPPPASVESAMRSQTGTLPAAQSRVPFTIVPPAGLPKDVVSEKIATIPTAVYSYVTHSWSVGSTAVWFVYRRADGRTMALLADGFDAREGPPSNHIFEDLGERNGREILVKHDKFTWRNGNQVMSAIADEGISAAEIARVRAAMHGVDVTGFQQHASIDKEYRLP
jgi:hypothetical protein